MLDILFILLNIISFLMFYLGIEYEGEHDYWNGVMTFAASILFLVFAFGGMSIETPYELYNPSTGLVETGFHSYVLGYWMILVYFGIFWVASFFYFLDLMFHEKLIRMFKWMKE